MTEAFKTELAEYLDGMIPLPAHWSPEQRAAAKRVGRANRDAQRRHELDGFVRGMRMASEVCTLVAAEEQDASRATLQVGG